MLKALINAVRFFWRASAGYRLRPWNSPYLRWRVETYTGKPAGSLRLADFLQLAWAERGQLGNFFRWIGELRELSRGKTA
jgi:hypothetical protein